MAFADNCHDILEIDLHKCLYVTDMAVTALITQCRQLRELRLAQCSRITDEAFGHLPQHDHFDALRILDLTDCNELTDCGLQKITMAAPRLRNLVLAKCRNIGDRGLQAITRLGKNLHFLHLGHCTSITDTGVSNLIKYCNRIRYIDFSCCINLTDESVSLLATLPKLKRIGLVKCNAITDRSIRALARPKPPGHHPYYPNNLERLHLSYCTNLSIRGVRTMLLHCPQLTHLSLTGVPPFLQDDLLRFCRPAPAGKCQIFATIFSQVTDVPDQNSTTTNEMSSASSRDRESQISEITSTIIIAPHQNRMQRLTMRRSLLTVPPQINQPETKVPQLRTSKLLMAMTRPSSSITLHSSNIYGNLRNSKVRSINRVHSMQTWLSRPKL